MFQLLEDMNGHEPCDKRQASRPEATVETSGNLGLVGVAGAFLAIDKNCAKAKSQWRRSFRQKRTSQRAGLQAFIGQEPTYLNRAPESFITVTSHNDLNERDSDRVVGRRREATACAIDGSPLDWETILFWVVLVIGVASIVVLAIRLVRQSAD